MDKNSHRPNSEKIKVIKYILAPMDMATLQSFLGMENYCNLYVTKMYKLRAPFNKLLKMNSKWNWLPVRSHLKILIKKYFRTITNTF